MRDWKKYVREQLPPGLFRGESSAELEEEIANHLEDTYAEALARGRTEVEAEAQALAEVEDWERLAADMLRTRKGAAPSQAGEHMESVEAALRRRGGCGIKVADLLQELRFTVRRLRRTPGFTAVVLLTLGLGIGATTAVFSVVKGVLLDPLPYDDADQLVSVWNAAPAMGEEQPGADRNQYYRLFELALHYLLDQQGAGRSVQDVRNVFIDLNAGIPFSVSFRQRFGMDVDDFEAEFFDRVRSYLSPVAALTPATGHVETGRL